MKSVSPWKPTEECPVMRFQDFKNALNRASYHYAGSMNEYENGKSCVKEAAKIAIEEDWAYWVIDRMFKEVKPLVDWDEFMQTYINILGARKQ